MTVCDNGHDEVCYESGSCPVCKEQEEVKELTRKVEELEKDIDNYEKVIGESENIALENIQLKEMLKSADLI